MEQDQASKKWDEVLKQLWRQSRFASYFYQAVTLAEEQSIPTIALGLFSRRFTLFYNPGFVEEMGRDELIGLLIHEMLHVALNHDHRSGFGKDPYLQNLAQDMVINSYLKEHAKDFFSRTGAAAPPPLKLPPGLPVIPKTFDGRRGGAAIIDVTWEELYQWLKEHADETISEEHEAAHDLEGLPSVEDWSGSGEEDGLSGEDKGLAFTDGKGKSLPTGIHLTADVRASDQADSGIRRILSFIQKGGECAGERAFHDVMGLIQGPERPEKVNWKALIRTIVDRSTPTMYWDHSYARLNRRFFDAGIYAPGRFFKPKPLITVAVDVSGSMASNPRDLELAFGAVEDLSRDYRISLVCIDQDLFVPRRQGGAFARSGGDRPYYYQKGDWRFIRTGGRGATFFAPLFNDYIKNHREMLIVVTDGCIYDIKALQPYYSTLWVVPERAGASFTPPFGRTVAIRGRS